MLDPLIEMLLSAKDCIVYFFESITIFGVELGWFLVGVFFIGILLTAVVNVIRQPSVSGEYEAKKNYERNKRIRGK